MTSPVPAAPGTIAVRCVLTGRVQGVGLRPAVARLALELGLCGRVSNEMEGVVVHVEGGIESIATFEKCLLRALPVTANVQEIRSSPALPEGISGFCIEPGRTLGALATEIPRDLPVCDDCLQELADTADRRFGYVFSSCTNCGPRYSIIRQMPYERADTAMSPFALCPDCLRETTTADDRRFHAQTNACPACGPIIRALTPEGRELATHAAAISRAAMVLLDGGIVAVQGLGGFQFLCDATNSLAISRLREHKRRPAKPLAVMVDAAVACLFTELDRNAFFDRSNPIVVLSTESFRRLCNGTTTFGDEISRERPRNQHREKRSICWSGDFAPGMSSLGVLRVTTPLHAELMAAVGRPCVVTSANEDGDPLAYDSDSAVRMAGPHCDLVLQHNRRIIRPVDDSVVRVMAGRLVTIRAARGIAPLPLWPQSLPLDAPPEAVPDGDEGRSSPPSTIGTGLLAVGGHQKVAVALSNGRQAILGPHIGDLDSLAARERYLQQTRDLLELYQAEPAAIVCDLHPDYFTTRWAEEEAERRRIPLIRVQHHHAHIAAGMLEQGWLGRTVLGVAFDGVGYGSDGEVWGGEFLRTTATDFHRVASLRPFALIGGEHAIRQPWRVAVSLLTQALGKEGRPRWLKSLASPEAIEATAHLVRRSRGISCSSLGRLFDGVASLVFRSGEARFEGELAMRLEAACNRSACGSYELPLDDTSGDRTLLDWRLLVRQVVKDSESDVPAGDIAMKFHRAIADAVDRVASNMNELPVVLGGGCFQNRVLTEEVASRLLQRQIPVGLPGSIPPNDGGLAAGQWAIGRARMNLPTGSKTATGSAGGPGVREAQSHQTSGFRGSHDVCRERSACV